MYKMILAPDANGYSSSDGNEWLRTELDGGAGRYRQDKLGAAKMISAKWTLNPNQYAYWRAFYNLVGSGPFLCDLVSDDGIGPVEHTVNIVPGSVQLPSQQGLTYVQQCTLEARPLPRDRDADESFVITFNAAEGNTDGWYLALERMANQTLPESFGA